MQTVYARGSAGGSQQRQVADGADVVFTDTEVIVMWLQSNRWESLSLVGGVA